MEEPQNLLNCAICGGDMEHAEQTEELLCEDCVDTWKREVDSGW